MIPGAMPLVNLWATSASAGQEQVHRGEVVSRNADRIGRKVHE